MSDQELPSIGPQDGPQRMFAESKADIAIFGGAAGGGKTWAICYEAVKWVVKPGIRNYGAVILRRTYPQITGSGSVWEEASKFYPALGGRPHAQSGAYWFKFPDSNSIVQFSHLQHDTSVQDHQSKQYAAIFFDQVEQFTEYQFWYLFSRNRSVCGVQPYMRAACNPDPDSFIKQLILWWLDDDGAYPRADRAGVLRWFYRIEDKMFWYDSFDEAIEAHMDMYENGILPTSFTFIPSKLEDNRELEKRDPQYRSKLEALPYIERMRLKGGNWAIRPAAGLVFRREWFEVIDNAPTDAVVTIRMWDKAATEAGPHAPDPDWTVGAKMSLHKNGTVVIHDVQRLRATPGRVDDTMKSVAAQDGKGCVVGVMQDPGQAGVNDREAMVRLLEGFKVHVERPSKDKVTVAGPLSSQAEHKNVKLLRGAWNDQFLSELVAFPDVGHDDQVDAAANGYVALVNLKGKQYPVPQFAVSVPYTTTPWS